MPVEAELALTPAVQEPTDAMTAGHPAHERHEALRRQGDALDGLSFEIARGEMFGLIGPDGAGKTTAIRLICGLLHADAGDVRVLGHDPARRAPRDHGTRSGTSRSASASTAT